MGSKLIQNEEIDNTNKNIQLRGPKKRKKQKGKFKPNFNIPGVEKIVLSYNAQKSIGCVVGDNVTAEKPWININKEIILEDLELLPEVSEFLPVKEQILQFPGPEILMGYIPDESSDVDEFYICLTEEAMRRFNKIVETLKRIQEESLKNALNRTPKPWISLGSEPEVEDEIIKYSRNLLEVEIESCYPIKQINVTFSSLHAQDSKYGYMEMKSSDDSQQLHKKRINASIQVTPSVVRKDVQTVCPFPKNFYTQYHYEVFVEPEMTENFVNVFKSFFDKSSDYLFDALKVNSHINLYINDYEKLILNPSSTIQAIIPESVEYLVFIDMALCQSKMVSNLAWHSTWTGCCVAAYVPIAPPLYLNSRLTTDEVYEAVHDTHPVLFWSFNDDLKPKLILETSRPVYALSCCPYNENLVIGGCYNGQIILWDITNKLHRVEEEEILSVDQQRYRLIMWSLMTWMKNVFNLAVVRATAMSDLKYSHEGCVNEICWMSPFQSTSKTGKIENIEKGGSLQFLTSGEEGCILIWDLLKKPVIIPGGFKGMTKMRRLKKRPSALRLEESSFKQLHLKLKPIYKINVAYILEDRLLSLASFFAIFYDPPFEKVHASKPARGMEKLAERVKFKPILSDEYSLSRPTFIVGTMEGDMIHAQWEGLNFDSGEVVNYEDCQFVSYGKYHDGPVIRIDYSSITNAVVSVGGKTFAIWREDFLNHPIVWRRTSSIYTDGSWFEFEKVSIKLIRIDGYLEFWNLFYKSKKPVYSRLTTNGAVTLITTHPRQMHFNVIGTCDYRGSFRLFYTDIQHPMIIEKNQKNMIMFLDKEIERKKNFLKWQQEWNEKYIAAARSKVLEAEEEQFEIAETTKKPDKKKITKVISPGLRYMNSVQEQQRANTQSRIKRIILDKKQLDTDKLRKQREPLTKIEEENEIKKHKQRNKLKTSDLLFKNTVDMYFPEVNIKKPPPPPDPYEAQFSDDIKMETYGTFLHLSVEAQDYVNANPFNADFSWNKVLKLGRDRRKKLDDAWNSITHHQRYQKIKDEKIRKILEAEEEALKASKKFSAPSLETTSDETLEVE